MSNYLLKYFEDVQELYFDFSTVLDPSDYILQDSAQIIFVKDTSGDVVIEEDSKKVGSKVVTVNISSGSPGLNPQVKCTVNTANGLTYTTLVDVLVWGEGS